MGTKTTTEKSDVIRLGSGDLYLVEYNSETHDLSEGEEKALIDLVCVDANRFGEVKNGGTFTYTPESYTEESDLGRAKKTIITTETAKLSCGLVTVSGAMLTKLVSTGEKTVANGYTTVRLGGIENDNGKRYICVFKQIDKTDGAMYVIILGKNTAELSFSFAKDSGTILNPEFAAEPLDSKGRLCVICFESKETEA